MGKIHKLLNNPYLGFRFLAEQGLLKWIPDEPYLRLMYRANLGKTLNLANPESFNEKLQWLKLNDRNPMYTQLVDKYAVKQWVADRIGAEYVNPTFQRWDSVDDISLDGLPDKFVLKTNHDCGGISICSNRDEYDLEKEKEKLRKHLNSDYSHWLREWPYKEVRRCVFAERYLEDAAIGDLPDYKFFCFNGEPKAMFIATERMKEGVETKFDFFDMDFNHLPFTNGHPNAMHDICRPSNFSLMKELASVLSRDIPHVRVDFYETREGIFFGEMTFFHWSGMVPFCPESWDKTFGSWITLPTQS